MDITGRIAITQAMAPISWSGGTELKTSDVPLSWCGGTELETFRPVDDQMQIVHEIYGLDYECTASVHWCQLCKYIDLSPPLIGVSIEGVGVL